MDTILYTCGVSYILRNLIYIYIYICFFHHFSRRICHRQQKYFLVIPEYSGCSIKRDENGSKICSNIFIRMTFLWPLTCLSREYKIPNFLVATDITAPRGARPSTGRCRWLRWPRYHRLLFHLLTHGDLNSMTDILQTKVSIALILCFQQTSDATYNRANKGRERLTVIHSQGASWTLTLIPLWISNYIYQKCRVKLIILSQISFR